MYLILATTVLNSEQLSCCMSLYTVICVYVVVVVGLIRLLLIGWQMLSSPFAGISLAPLFLTNITHLSKSLCSGGHQ